MSEKYWRNILVTHIKIGEQNILAKQNGEHIGKTYCEKYWRTNINIGVTIGVIIGVTIGWIPVLSIPVLSIPVLSIPVLSIPVLRATAAAATMKEFSAKARPGIPTHPGIK